MAEVASFNSEQLNLIQKMFSRRAGSASRSARLAESISKPTPAPEIVRPEPSPLPTPARVREKVVLTKLSAVTEAFSPSRRSPLKNFDFMSVYDYHAESFSQDIFPNEYLQLFLELNDIIHRVEAKNLPEQMQQIFSLLTLGNNNECQSKLGSLFYLVFCSQEKENTMIILQELFRFIEKNSLAKPFALGFMKQGLLFEKKYPEQDGLNFTNFLQISANGIAPDFEVAEFKAVRISSEKNLYDLLLLKLQKLCHVPTNDANITAVINLLSLFKPTTDDLFAILEKLMENDPGKNSDSDNKSYISYGKIFAYCLKNKSALTVDSFEKFKRKLLQKLPDKKQYYFYFGFLKNFQVADKALLEKIFPEVLDLFRKGTDNIDEKAFLLILFFAGLPSAEEIVIKSIELTKFTEYSDSLYKKLNSIPQPRTGKKALFLNLEYNENELFASVEVLKKRLSKIINLSLFEQKLDTSARYNRFYEEIKTKQVEKKVAEIIQMHKKTTIKNLIKALQNLKKQTESASTSLRQDKKTIAEYVATLPDDADFSELKALCQDINLANRRDYSDKIKELFHNLVPQKWQDVFNYSGKKLQINYYSLFSFFERSKTTSYSFNSETMVLIANFNESKNWRNSEDKAFIIHLFQKYIFLEEDISRIKVYQICLQELFTNIEHMSSSESVLVENLKPEKLTKEQEKILLAILAYFPITKEYAGDQLELKIGSQLLTKFQNQPYFQNLVLRLILQGLLESVDENGKLIKSAYFDNLSNHIKGITQDQINPENLPLWLEINKILIAYGKYEILTTEAASPAIAKDRVEATLPEIKTKTNSQISIYEDQITGNEDLFTYFTGKDLFISGIGKEDFTKLKGLFEKVKKMLEEYKLAVNSSFSELKDQVKAIKNAFTNYKSFLEEFSLFSLEKEKFLYKYVKNYNGELSMEGPKPNGISPSEKAEELTVENFQQTFSQKLKEIQESLQNVFNGFKFNVLDNHELSRQYLDYYQKYQKITADFLKTIERPGIKQWQVLQAIENLLKKLKKEKRWTDPTPKLTIENINLSTFWANLKETQLYLYLPKKDAEPLLAELMKKAFDIKNEEVLFEILDLPFLTNDEKKNRLFEIYNKNKTEEKKELFVKSLIRLFERTTIIDPIRVPLKDENKAVFLEIQKQFKEVGEISDSGVKRIYKKTNLPRFDYIERIPTSIMQGICSVPNIDLEGYKRIIGKIMISFNPVSIETLKFAFSLKIKIPAGIKNELLADSEFKTFLTRQKPSRYIADSGEELLICA